jgi:small subunit ribosomal protein S6
MNSYELVVIYYPDLTEEQLETGLKKIAGTIQNMKGIVTAQDKWGKRTFAYPIKKLREGFYYLFAFNAEPNSLGALTSLLKVESGIVRSLLVKKLKYKVRKHKETAPKPAPEVKENIPAAPATPAAPTTPAV